VIVVGWNRDVFIVCRRREVLECFLESYRLLRTAEGADIVLFGLNIVC